MFNSGPGNRSAGDPKKTSKVDNTLRRGMPGARAQRCLFGSRPKNGDPQLPTKDSPCQERGRDPRVTRWSREKPSAPQAKVRTARHKVCPLLCEALAAVGARTGVGTPFPLRLLAQTSALWRGPIFHGLPSSEIWETLYIVVYVYFGARNYSAGDPTAALKSGQHFTRSDARCHGTAKPFWLKV